MKKILPLLLSCILFVACKKDKTQCYYYDVEEWCVPKGTGIYGCQTHTYQSNFKECNSYAQGEVVMYHEDANVKQYRKFSNKK
jgi:hypothetical protein